MGREMRWRKMHGYILVLYHLCMLWAWIRRHAWGGVASVAMATSGLQSVCTHIFMSVFYFRSSFPNCRSQVGTGLC